MKAKASKGERSFPFLQINEREQKSRKRGLTEIGGPYYSVVGRRYLKDLFEMMGNYVDSLKFAGGSIIARSCNWNACAPVFGAQRACGGAL